MFELNIIIVVIYLCGQQCLERFLYHISLLRKEKNINCFANYK